VGTVEGIAIKPERFGRYVLLDRIGVGGMAEVFRAVMPGAQGFQRTFVVKRIIAARAQSPYFVDMFVREARINAILHHPNIVQVFDFGEVGGTYFLAMEYVRGRDVAAVARRLRERRLRCPVGVAAFIAHEVAEALAYAHALTAPDGAPLNLVHRDVSPSNIICPRAGGVKLLDFGIAQALNEPEGQNPDRMFKGKIAYVAPERLRGQAADARSDLFSLGVVLWELLAGRKLFRTKSDAETLENVLKMPVPPPSSLRPDVPAELDRIVARALARDPADRYATGYQLAEDLDGVLTAAGHQPRAVPALLRDLFGTELSSRQIPTPSVMPEVLAAPAGVGPARPRASRWTWWVAASSGTFLLLVLLFGRGGGGRTHATPALTAARPAAPAPSAPRVVEMPAPPEAASPAPEPPRASRRSRSSGKGRIARGLSIDPFAEAASRVQR